MGLYKLLGLETESELARHLAGGEAAIAQEIVALRNEYRDLANYTDGDWLQYVKEDVAQEKAMAAGMPSATLDEGHSQSHTQCSQLLCTQCSVHSLITALCVVQVTAACCSMTS